MLRKNKFKRKFKTIKRNIKTFFKNHKKLALISSFFLIIFIWWKIAFNYYVNNPKNLIKSVFFNKNILNNPNFSWLVTYTQQALSGQNTVKNKFLHYDQVRQNIKQHYPFVEKISIQPLNSNSVKVSFQFKTPSFYFVGSGLSFAVYDKKTIIPFKTAYLTWNLSSGNKIYLPKYILNKNNLNLIFWKTPYDKILNYSQQIQKQFSGSKIYFLPGAEYFKVFYKDKAYLISTEKDLQKQFKQLEIIKTQLPEKFKNASQIDLGSLENKIFLKEINN